MICEIERVKIKTFVFVGFGSESDRDGNNICYSKGFLLLCEHYNHLKSYVHKLRSWINYGWNGVGTVKPIAIV